ncbi:MAG: glycosyltransferase family 4 protein [Bacteriovorax sp.]|nr:glycosyltransferase family 4 protein [Bacteriovorax sp.]
MKIIHVTQFLGVGGLEKIIYHLALEQQKRGHNIAVYIYDYDRSWVDFFRSSGLTVITPKIKKLGYDYSLLKAMNHDLFSADIIHSHDLNPLLYLGPLSLWKKLTFQKRPKLIHTTHGLEHIDNYPRGKLYQRIFSRLADKMIGVSETIGNFYLEDIKLSAKNVMVIPNGVSTFNGSIDQKIRKEKKSWLAQRHGLDSNRPIILSLSRVVPLKDQRFLMTALKHRPDYQLIIVGPSGDHDYYNELKNLEDKNIKLIGSQELVLEYNMGSDMYVSASTHEGIPVAVLEAMAVENPCLISEIPGHMTLLKHGSFVETFKLGDIEDFLKKFDLMFKNIEDTKTRAKKSRVLVEEYYSVKKMVNNYLQVYES